ncbi:hypothetical protein KFK09_020908 [Dendrobium nobile]|uniref:Uncharacterized protein n=1 Tax=Dendrobium nobile TaxID=94219 RepID=A0A8T3AUB6_DENNO|nr:hypothetical protein KFK09_020908 [Dendrobium nobile]
MNRAGEALEGPSTWFVGDLAAGERLECPITSSHCLSWAVPFSLKGLWPSIPSEYHLRLGFISRRNIIGREKIFFIFFIFLYWVTTSVDSRLNLTLKPLCSPGLWPLIMIILTIFMVDFLDIACMSYHIDDFKYSELRAAMSLDLQFLISQGDFFESVDCDRTRFEERENLFIKTKISEEREREKEKEKSWFSEAAERFSSDAAVGESVDLVVRVREQEIGVDPDLQREREKEKEKSWFSEAAERFSSDAAVGESVDLVVRVREQEIGVDPDLQVQAKAEIEWNLDWSFALRFERDNRREATGGLQVEVQMCEVNFWQLTLPAAFRLHKRPVNSSDHSTGDRR